MRLRQIALVGKDLWARKADIEAVLGLGEAYLDPGVGKYGLDNQVWPIGDTFLEVVSPKQPGTTAERLLDKRGGDGGYMAIFQTDDIEAARTRFETLGVRTVSQADFDGVHMSHLHPKDVGGCIVSVDQMTPPERWEWGGPGWQAHVRPRYQATTLVGLATWTPREDVVMHLNLGRDFIHAGGDEKRAGVSVEWSPRENWWLTAERYVEQQTHFVRAALRWAASEDWTFDVSRAHRLHGPGESGWTIGVTRRIGR